MSKPRVKGSIYDEVRALALEGHSPHQIAHATKLGINLVNNIITQMPKPTKHNKGLKKIPVAPPAPPVQAHKYERRFDFNASSTQKTVGLLRPVAAPVLLVTPEVMKQINYIVKVCEGEVGWMGLVKPHEERPGDYLLYRIYIPEQEVSKVTTEIEPETMVDLVEEILKEDHDPSHLLYWGHSHVNMGVTPSGRDEEQLDEYLDPDVPYFFRGIYNKRGEYKVDMVDLKNNLLHLCIDSEIDEPLDKETQAHIDGVLKRNVHTWQTNARAYPSYLQQKQPQQYPSVDAFDSNDWGLRGFTYDD